MVTYISKQINKQKEKVEEEKSLKPKSLPNVLHCVKY